jgi:DNA-binding PadR family transcriptional regulator
MVSSSPLKINGLPALVRGEELMSIRHSLLALLSEAPQHGYGLKAEFEKTTSGTWPLNVGQVYTTLARLERDALVEPLDEGGEDRQTWRITRRGRAALERWYASPVVDEPPSRDELALKVLLAVASADVEATDILQRQRVATMERLQQYARHKRAADPDRELAWLLVLDSLSLKAEAELAWLDLCEQRLRDRHLPGKDRVRAPRKHAHGGRRGHGGDDPCAS